MNIVFRADASTQIGTGHVMRCLTLADFLSMNGAVCQFICKKLDGNIISIIEKKGYQVFPIKPDIKSFNSKKKLELYDSWLSSSQQSDASSSIEYVKELKPQWIVVDSYSLDRSWEKLLRPYCSNMLVIDDLANRLHDCDLLLDQTVLRSFDNYKNKVNDGCYILCGTEYSLLRPEFKNWRLKSKNKMFSDLPFKILLNLGGVDQNDNTSKIIDALVNCQLPKDTEITIVMGPQAPFLKKVLKKSQLLPCTSFVYSGVSNMAELMSGSHICIGAAGSTSWERCCVGLPSIIVVIADNQRAIAKNLEACGAAVAIDIENVIVELDVAIKKLLDNWSAYREACFKVVDGSGCSRVIHAMKQVANGALK